ASTPPTASHTTITPVHLTTLPPPPSPPLFPYTTLFRSRARLHGLDLPQVRAEAHDRPLRGRVERLRPADAAHEDDPQHQAPDPAVEDRAARRLHAGAQEGEAAEPGDLAAPADPEAGAGALRPASRPRAGALLLRAAARVRGERRRVRGAAARGDAPQPHPPRRARGARAHPAA